MERAFNLILEQVDCAPVYRPGVVVEVDRFGRFFMADETWRITHGRTEPQPDQPDAGLIPWAVCAPLTPAEVAWANRWLAPAADD